MQQEKLFQTAVTNYLLWPLAHCINFKYVPARFRSLFNNYVLVRIRLQDLFPDSWPPWPKHFKLLSCEMSIVPANCSVQPWHAAVHSQPSSVRSASHFWRISGAGCCCQMIQSDGWAASMHC